MIDIILGFAGVMASAWGGWAAWKAINRDPVESLKKRKKESLVSLPPSYEKIARAMTELIPESDDPFPRSMLSETAQKSKIAKACLDLLEREMTTSDRVFIAMSTTCHLVFESLVRSNSYAQKTPTIFTSNLPVLLSALVQRIPCETYGNHLVHEYGSLSLSAATGSPDVYFDNSVVGVRGITIANGVIEVRTCKEEHRNLLRKAIENTRSNVFVCFDLSKLACSDGTTFLRLSCDGLDVRMQRSVSLTFISCSQEGEQDRKFEIFDSMLKRSGFKCQKLGDISAWSLDSRSLVECDRVDA
jgi:DeoR/GlpR family transcriptional regulator of sugar metabolism